MTSHSPGRATPYAWVGPVAASLAMQTVAAYLSRLTPTLAPLLALAIGWEVATVGYLSSLLTLGAMTFLLLGHPIIDRMGSVRCLQGGMVIGAIGTVLIAVPHPVAPIIGCFLLGLCYGPTASAGTDLLQRYAPPARRNLVFSIKQAGVPLGGVIAGLTLASLAQWIGLQAALLSGTAAAIAVMFLVQPLRAHADASRNPARSVHPRDLLSLGNAARPLRAIFRQPMLRRLGMAGACLAIGQGVWMTFLVTYLYQALQLSLTAAGAMFAVMQVTSTFGRVFLGWLSDRLGSAVLVLRVAAVASAGSTLLLAAATPHWPTWAIAALCALGGLSVSSWNGIQMALLAKAAPAGAVAESAGGATLLIFGGFIMSPVVVGTSLQAGLDFGQAFSIVACINLLAVLILRGLQVGR